MPWSPLFNCCWEQIVQEHVTAAQALAARWHPQFESANGPDSLQLRPLDQSLHLGIDNQSGLVYEGLSGPEMPVVQSPDVTQAADSIKLGCEFNRKAARFDCMTTLKAFVCKICFSLNKEKQTWSLGLGAA